jgi:NADPH:quinone reductase-like Zn-dependent oxidoreductase
MIVITGAAGTSAPALLALARSRGAQRVVATTHAAALGSRAEE